MGAGLNGISNSAQHDFNGLPGHQQRAGDNLDVDLVLDRRTVPAVGTGLNLHELNYRTTVSIVSRQTRDERWRHERREKRTTAARHAAACRHVIHHPATAVQPVHHRERGQLPSVPSATTHNKSQANMAGVCLHELRSGNQLRNQLLSLLFLGQFVSTETLRLLSVS